MLKITRLFEKLALKIFRTSNNEVIGNNSNRANKTVLNLSNKSKNNKFRNLTHMPNIKATRKPLFLIFNAKKTFNYLRQAFIKAPIFQYFNLESYIWIETNISNYVIGKIFS